VALGEERRSPVVNGGARYSSVWLQARSGGVELGKEMLGQVRIMELRGVAA